MQPTPLDLAIALGILLSVLGACHRGLGREMLHTVLFAILVAIGYVLFRKTGFEDPNRTVFWLVNSTYYLITAYVLTWVGMKVLAPLMLSSHDTGLRSRFWAGVLSIAKLSAVIFGLNLWFAVHSPQIHPDRLLELPPIMRDSVFIRMTDKTTEHLYLWLADNGILDYHKNLQQAPTLDDQRKQDLENMLGVSPTEAPIPPAPLQPDEAQ